jgi:hypothetical protein
VSRAGGRHARLIQTAKPNDIDPEAWLVGVLRCIVDTPPNRFGDLPPWNTPTRPHQRRRGPRTTQTTRMLLIYNAAERALRSFALAKNSWLFD